MPYDAKIYNVMLASPGDLVQERITAKEVIYDWNALNAETQQKVLLPISWETHSSPGIGEPPQDIINKQILIKSDLLIGIFWTRVGTPTANYASGTIEEIYRHAADGKPAMLYFSEALTNPSDIDHEQYKKLQEFRDSCQSICLYETFQDLNDFKEKFRRQLHLQICNENYFKEKRINHELWTDGDNIPYIQSRNPSPMPWTNEKNDREPARTVIIDEEACTGCGTCAAIAEDCFELDLSTEKAFIKVDGFCPEDDVQEAIDTCPEEAIAWG